MIKKILVPLDPSDYSKKALDVACTLAKFHKSEITGVTILDLAGIKESIGTIPLGAAFYAQELTDVKLKESEKRINELVNSFENTCIKNEIPYKVSKLQGMPSEQIVEVSKYYDLVVMGKRTFFHFETQNTSGDSFSRVLNHSITPILAIPKQFDLNNLSHQPLKIMIAFDGSLPACRALQRFAHLGIDEFCDIHIVMSSNDKEFAKYSLAEAKALLNAHNLQHVTEYIHTEDIIEIIEDKYLEWADIFVVGLHSKPAILNFITGNVTNYVVDKSKKAIFIGL